MEQKDLLGMTIEELKQFEMCIRDREKPVNRSTGQSVLLSYVINEMLFHGAFDNEAPAT